SRLVQTAAEAPVLVAATEGAPEGSIAGLRRLGCEVLRLPGGDRRSHLAALLDELGRRRLTNVLVEGGAAVLGSFRDSAGALDEVHVFIAPRLVGGAGASTPIAGIGATVLVEGLVLKDWRVELVEDNVLVQGRL